MIDDRTSNLNLPLPSSANRLIEDVARIRDALDAIDAAIHAITSGKGVANGFAGLDAGGKVPAAQLPSYVDDVLEYANFAAFPGSGESGKIYIAIDTGKTYRWSGSAYVEITASPGSTDAVPEGSTNKYFTDQRARDAQLPATAGALGVVRVGSGLVVNGSGVLSVVGGGTGGGLPSFNEMLIVPTSNGQTSFTISGGYTAGVIDLFLNGVLLFGNGEDYTASDGSTIVLNVGVNTTDTLLLRRWTTATNLPFAAVTDTPTTLAGYGITDAASDDEVVKLTGDQSVDGVKTFVKRTKHAGAYTESVQPGAHSATPTFDCATSNVFEPPPMTGNITSITLSNAAAGQTVQIAFQQDGTGGRTVALPAGAKVDGSIATGANRVSILVMTYSGRRARWEGNWVQVPA